MIFYREGYKYQLAKNYTLVVSVAVDKAIRSEFITMVGNKLTIKRGYAWDGPSGPTIDTKNFMRGSLVHDALYQLIREKRLGQECRKEADKILREICKEDGMSSLRAWWVYQGVRFGGAAAATPCPDNCWNETLTAP